MMWRSVKLVFVVVLLLMGAAFSTSLKALEFVVLNDVSDIAKTKKIMLKVDLSRGERWAYREMFRFSSSNPTIVLRSWKASVASTSEYIVQFHQTKRVFAGSFDIELTFDSPGVEDAALVEQLEQATVMVSYVVFTDVQKHKAHTEVVKLVDRAKEAGDTKKDAILGLALSMTTTIPGVVVDSSVAKAKAFVPDDEITYLIRGEKFYTQLGDLVERIQKACASLFMSIVFGLVSLLLLMRFLMRSHPRLGRYYPVTFAHTIFALLPPALIYLIAAVVSSAVASILLGGYFLVLGCYIVVTQHEKPKTFKTKSLLLLGGICIVMALPLVLKGILLFYS